MMLKISNLAPKFLYNGGCLAPNVAFFEENFLTKEIVVGQAKVWGTDSPVPTGRCCCCCC